jgi:hypothetical protein
VIMKPVPVNVGLAPEEIEEMLGTGWVLAGRQAVRVGGGIIDPSKPIPPSGVIDHDIWILVEPTVSVGRVVNVLVDAGEMGMPVAVLDYLCKHIVGDSYDNIRRAVMAARASAAEGGQ